MGYEMSKPNLRAELEADLKHVSEGRKDKWSVLQHHIQKYKSVFIESVQKAKKWVNIRTAGRSLFDHDDHFLLFPQVRRSSVPLSGRSSGYPRGTTAGHGDPPARQEVSPLWAGHDPEEEKGRKRVRRDLHDHSESEIYTFIEPFYCVVS